MKIGLLSYRSNPFSGGQGIYVKHLSLALTKLGHQVDVISGPPYPDLHEDINLIEIPSLNLFELEDNLRLRSFRPSFLFNLADFREWLGVLSGSFPEPYAFGKRVNIYLDKTSTDYDLIHDNQSLCHELINIQKEIPLVTTIHHPITRDRRLALEAAATWKERLSINRWHSFLRMQKKVAPQLNRIVCPSNQSKADVIEELKVNEENIDVVLNGIDLDSFTRDERVEQKPYRIITTASADVPLKGLKFLIEAMTEIIEEIPEAHLMVLGRAKEKGDIAKLISRLNLEEKISFRSGLSQSEVVSLYSSSHICVIPSLYEGFGFGAGEAMACGLPLISTQSGGLKEVIGQEAVIIEAASSEAIIKAVKDLFSNKEKQLALSRAGRKRMEKEFNWMKAAEAYEKIYSKTIKEFHN
ncbi:MAG: glycosyltransferase family 4 protein [SAR86 cluster bacterium]|jgi:glycosyltransferase involved in cell wall biosynthesis|tara:strand:+ start:63 stop:1298 length:1236 start_codon:yes stop_codon:yes gene_type:complete